MGAIDTILQSMTGKTSRQTVPAPVKVATLWHRMNAWYRKWSAFHRSREQLRQLTDSELADIGITRAQAEEEANRPPRFRF